MKVSPISPTQLTQFAQVTDRPASAEPFAKMLKAMWANGESKPEWCFLIEENDEAVGRIGFFKVDGQDDNLAILGWTLPWDGDYADLGTQSLAACLQQLMADGVRSVARELHSHWPTLAQQKSVLEGVGFRPIQDQCVYLLEPTNNILQQSTDLHFNPLETIGDEQFIDAICRATEGTADRTIQTRITERGSMRAFVEEDFRFLKNDHIIKPGWFSLAYDADDVLVGFIQSVRFPDSDEGNIANIGVVPEQRGNGYSHLLLAEATDLLSADGVSIISARTDTENVAMRRSFERAGYRLDSTVTTMLYEGDTND